MEITTTLQLEHITRIISYELLLPMGEMFIADCNSLQDQDGLNRRFLARELLIAMATKVGISESELQSFLSYSIQNYLVELKSWVENYQWLIRKVDSLLKSSIVYLAGPISGIPYEEAVKNFQRAEEWLKGQGYEVLNPINIVPSTASWNLAMRAVIPYLVYCDKICCLPGWEKSRGARMEVFLATHLGMEIMFYEEV